MSEIDEGEKRTTRSASSSNRINLNDIKTLIDDRMKELTVLIQNTKKEILETFREEMDELCDKVDGVKEDVLELQKSNEMLKKKTAVLEGDLNRIKENLMQGLHVHEAAGEMEERERRRLNLIVSGLPESSSESDENQKQDDIDSFDEILTALDIRCSDLESNTVADVRRIGRHTASTGNRPRLIKVKCKTIEQKIEILKKSKDLRSSIKFKTIYINPDRTLMQRALQKRLREELNERRKTGEDVIIYQDCVVARQTIATRPMRHFRHRF